jgi:hypothetical protein
MLYRVDAWTRALLRARHLSRRGGELHCRDGKGGVCISGHAVLYLEGALRL